MQSLAIRAALKLVLLTALLTFSGAASAQVVINELHADPAADLTGDANNDGIRDASEDEFVELVNTSGADLDISGWTISDAVGVRHTFPAGTVVANNCSVVVFGGGSPAGAFGDAVVQVASTGLIGLNNSGDTVTVNDGSSDVATYTYGSEGGDNQSLTRDPDITGPDPLIKHTVATGSGGTLFSPGTQIDGTAFSGCSSSAGSSLVINEVHADPAPDIAGDANGDGVRDATEDEFVELVNTSGADLDISGWTISDAVAVRHTFPAGTVVANNCSVVVFGGGSPAGAFGDAVVQVASTGALGLNNSGDTVTVTDGGSDTVLYSYGSEGGSNQSLTRDPDITGLDPLILHTLAIGSGGTLFSPGTQIDGTAFSGCSAGASEVLVINEILPNPSAVSDSDGEWFEIYNPMASGVDIDGWTIADLGFDTHVINNGGPLLVPAGGYVVLGINADSGSNGGVTVDYQYSGFLLGNSGDEIVLFDGSGFEVDRVEYDNGTTFPHSSGVSMALIDPALDNNAAANWCASSTPFGDGDLGTPGAMNDCPIEVPDFVINEIMQNPAAVSDSAGEWFEVHNTTDADIDINGWTILDNDSDLHVIDNGGPLLVPAGGFLVLGINADFATNGGVDVAYQYSNVFLGNSSDELVMLDTGGSEIDRVEWDNGATFPDPTGASMSLLDPALDNNVGANWCESVTPFGAGDLGTPGDENSCVFVIPPFGACGDEAVYIWQVQGDGPSSPWDGIQGVILEGVVVGDFQASDELQGFFLQEEDFDADGDPATSDGIFVYDNGFGPDVNEGDVVRVQGTVDEFFGMTELTDVINMADCGYNDFATASVITLPRSSVDDWEATEGMAVTFPQTLVASGHRELGRFGEVELALGAPLDAPTNVVPPGAPANVLQDLNDVSRIQLGRRKHGANPAAAAALPGSGQYLAPGRQRCRLDRRARLLVRQLRGAPDFRCHLHPRERPAVRRA